MRCLFGIAYIKLKVIEPSFIIGIIHNRTSTTQSTMQTRYALQLNLESIINKKRSKHNTHKL